jgi:hypothetical protein
MSVPEIMSELDNLILRHWGDLDASLATEEGKQLFRQLTTAESRGELDAWYSSFKHLNPAALDLKKKLELALGRNLDGCAAAQGTRQVQL